MTARKFAGSSVRHGTTSGWSRHKALGQDPCAACYKAKAAYDERRRTASDVVLRSRLSAQAQSRANTRLKAKYPKEYRAMYEEERDRLFIEAGIEPPRV